MVITSSTKWPSIPFNSSIAAAGASSLHLSPSSSTTTSSSSSSSALQTSSTATFSLPSSPPRLTTSCRPGSVLGLKSCHLSLPSTASSIAHLDLHNHSSRRFIEAIVSDSPLHQPTNNKPRSAGSFRLEYESFSRSGKDIKELDAFHGGKPISTLPTIAGRWSFKEKLISAMPWYPTIDTPIIHSGCTTEGKPISTMPWCTSTQNIAAPTVPKGAVKQCNEGEFQLSSAPSDGDNRATTTPRSTILDDVAAVHTRAASRLNVELEGEISAADVDLLPMPGLVSLASPLYDSYLSVSPTDSRMTRISSSDYLSTANSSKTSPKTAPDYLGLPPEILQAVNVKHPYEPSTEVHDLGCPMMKGVRTSSELNDIQIAAASHSTITSSYPVMEDDNFAESQSLAGLWGTHDDEVNCNSDSVLHGSEGLASILPELPHKQGSTSSNCNHDEEHCIGAEFMMDDLDYLMMPGKAEAYAQGARNASQQHINVNGLQLVDVSTARENHLGAVPYKPEVVIHTGGGHNAPSCTSPYPNFHCQQGSSSLVTEGAHCQSSQGASILAQRNPFLPSTCPGEASQYVSNGSQSMPASSVPIHMERTHIPIAPPHLMIGKKRPLPPYEHQPRNAASALMFNPSNIPHILACQTMSLQQEKQQENQAQEFSYASATQAFSAMLYKAQGGGTGQNRFNWAPSYMKNSGESIRIPPPKSRRRHGTAMDPQSIAARTRREKFSDRIRVLQSLVPNGERLDTVSMLGQTLEYVRFLQHQVWQLYHGMDPASNIKCEKWKDFVEPAQATAPT